MRGHNDIEVKNSGGGVASKELPEGAQKFPSSSDQNEDEDEIVIIDDDEKEASPSRNKSGYFEETDPVLLHYRGHSVSAHDYKTLEDEEFLNDSIINFYLSWLLEEKVSEDERKEIHIFSSHFFSRLTSKPPKGDRVQAFEKDPEKSKAEKSYLRVKRWTKKIDIFSKKFILVPICDQSHWFLILICNPGSMAIEKDRRVINGEPFMVVLDSLGGTNSIAINSLRMYLQLEFLEKKNKVLRFSAWKTVYPKIPQQLNSSDCGVFLLQYAEKILGSRCTFLWPRIPDLSSWFTLDEIAAKRADIAELIQKLRRAQNPDDFNSVQFPKIFFIAEGPKEERLTVSGQSETTKATGRSTSSAEKSVNTTVSQKVTVAKNLNDKINRIETRRSLKRLSSSSVSSTSVSDSSSQMGEEKCNVVIKQILENTGIMKKAGETLIRTTQDKEEKEDRKTELFDSPSRPSSSSRPSRQNKIPVVEVVQNSKKFKLRRKNR